MPHHAGDLQLVVALDPEHEERIAQLLRLLRRIEELEAAMRRPGGIRITQERELSHLRERLQPDAPAVEDILNTARRLQRPIGALTADDVMKRHR